MTSDNQTRQPSKRFAKLDAIPPHERMPVGVGSVLAKLYIARKITLSASAAVMVAAGGALVAMNSLVPPGADAAVETAAAVPQELADLPIATQPLPEEDAVEREVASSTLPEKKTQEIAMPSEVASAFASKTEGKAPPEPVDASGKDLAVTKPDYREDMRPVRQIIPIAEGLDLYRKPASEDHVPPHVVDIAGSSADKDAGAFTLPTAGVPLEGDLSEFLSAEPPHAAPGEISVIEPEDLSPTIVLPEQVPFPETRPTPSAAAGQKVEFRIVQGPGVKSGFWIGNEKDPSVRRFFVIVKSFAENGSSVNWKFTNIADGSPADTDIMAVEVTEDAFIDLAKESKEFGMVRDPVLGQGVAGKKDVKWRIPSVEGNLLAGWDKETRK